MGEALIRMLLPLSARERWLLGGLFGLVVPLGIFFGLLQPLADARQAASEELTAARSTTQWVMSQVAEARTLGLSAPGASSEQTAPIGSAEIEQSLIDAGLRGATQELSQTDAGALALRFEDVRFTDLAEWLSESDPSWGYRLSQLRIEAAERSGLVSAALTLSPPEL